MGEDKYSEMVMQNAFYSLNLVFYMHEGTKTGISVFSGQREDVTVEEDKMPTLELLGLMALAQDLANRHAGHPVGEEARKIADMLEQGVGKEVSHTVGSIESFGETLN